MSVQGVRGVVKQDHKKNIETILPLFPTLIYKSIKIINNNTGILLQSTCGRSTLESENKC